MSAIKQISSRLLCMCRIFCHFGADVQQLLTLFSIKPFSFMVSLLIFTSSLNRKLVVRDCSYMSPIFLANVMVEVKTSCQNLFCLLLRSFNRNSGPHCKVQSKRDKSCMSINLHVALLWWNLFIHNIYKDFMNWSTSGMFSPPSSSFLYYYLPFDFVWLFIPQEFIR